MAATPLASPAETGAPALRPSAPGSSAPLRAAVGQAQVRFRMARVIVALMLREIATRYGRSPGGYLWEIAEPVAGIALLSSVFALTFAMPAIGTNFALFYASGYLVFQMYHDIANKVATSLRFSRPLLAYPAVTFVDALLARLILNVATHLVVVVVVIGGIALIYDLPLVMDVGTVLHALGLTALFAAGLGTLNCFLMMRFPVWERAWSILSRPLFLMSGVFFTYGAMPTQAQHILWYNPLIHAVGLTRKGIYGTYNADYVSPFYVYSVSIVLLFFGLLLLNRHHSRLLES